MCNKDMQPEEIAPAAPAAEPATQEEPTEPRTDGLAEVNEALRALGNLFEQKIARDLSQLKMFDALYDEMKSYKEGFLLESLHKPVIRQLITLHDSFGLLESQLDGILDGNKRSGADELEQFRNNLGNVRVELEEVLCSMDVTPYEERLEVLDRKLHKTLGRQPTDDPDQDRKVAQVHKIGFYWKDKVFRPEEVTIFRYKPPEARKGEDIHE